MLFDLNGARATFLLYERELNHALKRLTAQQIHAIESFLNRQIEGKDYVNSSQLGAAWRGTPLETLWNSDPNVYGLVFGALLWKIFLERPEQWIYKKKDDLKEISGMDYFRKTTVQKMEKQ